MKCLKNNIKIIALSWFLIQGILLLLNNLRVYFENKNHFIDFLFIISICIIIISLLLLIKNKKIIILSGVLLLLYSIFALFAMALLFLLEAHSHILFNICLCFIIPIINIFVSVMLLLKKNACYNCK
jgi:hypothetical protein